MKKLVIMAIGCSMLILTACNTVQGAGRDIESVGKTGEDVIN